MKAKRLLSFVLTLCMVFSMFTVLTLTSTVPASAESAETEKAIFIGSTSKLTAAFIPMDITENSDGSTAMTGTHYYKLSFKCKMLKNGNNGTNPGMPSIGICHTNSGTKDATETEPAWAGDYTTNTAASLSDGQYSMRFKINYGSAPRLNTENFGYRSFYITIGNAACRGAAQNSYVNYGASFIFSDISLYECDSDGSNVQETNYIPQINDDNIDFNGTYFIRKDKCTQYDSPYASTPMKWHVLSDPGCVKKITVPSDYNTSSSYDSANFSQTAATAYTREYYTNTNYSGVKFAKLKNSNNAGFEVIPDDISKKMVIIDANHEGEEDYLDTTKPTKNKPANIFIPLSLGRYNMTQYGVSNNSTVLVKVTFKAIRLEGDATPVLGRITGSNNGDNGSRSRAYGLAAKNIRGTGYYTESEYSASTSNGGGNRPANSYNAATGEFEGYVIMQTANNSNASCWGCNELLTIGNAEHVWAEGSFDSTSFNSSFAISDIKVDVYSTTLDGTTYSLGSLLAEDIAPALTAENIDDTSNWAFQCSGSNAFSRHSNDPIRASQYKWSVDGCTGMVHAENLTACMNGAHALTKNAATETTREYYTCATCSKNFADAYGKTEISDLTLTQKMITFDATAKRATAFYPMKLGGFSGNRWFKFTCKVDVLRGNGSPVVSSVYAKYDGTNACDDSPPVTTANDGDYAFFESSYDPATGLLTGYMKAWNPTNYNKSSRYPYIRYNPVTGNNFAIVVGNGRYVGSGYSDITTDTEFAITEPEFYMLDCSASGNADGLAAAKAADIISDNLVYSITDKTTDMSDGYTDIWSSPQNPLSAPEGKWYKLTRQSDTVDCLSIPEGYFELEDFNYPKMLRLAGAKRTTGQQAVTLETHLEAGSTYQFDLDYRAFGGVTALIDIQTAEEGGSYSNSLVTYTNTADNVDGVHRSVRFTMPANARSNNNFKTYLGQKWPLRNNGSVYFANASLRKVNGDLLGANLFANGDFHESASGTLTSGFTLNGWGMVNVLDYPLASLMPIPDYFFEEERDYTSDIAFEFKGGDIYKPQFNFLFRPNKTYDLYYDYQCDPDTTVNAYILSKDNSLSATKLGSTWGRRRTAHYRITTSASTQTYDTHITANGSIRFALNGNSYEDSFYLSNIGIYENNAGENLVGDLNPIFDDANYAALEETGDFVGFELSKDDTNADAQKAVVGHGWNGNLDYNEKRGAGMFARLVKVEDGFFNYYSDADKLIKMVKHLLASDTQYNPFADTMNPLYDPNADGQSNILDLVRVKKNIVYSAYTVTGEETNGGIYGSVSTVACYGDSITQGMGYENSLEKTYPGRLNTMLGGGYTVVNCGDPGERSFTIMARQGALSLVTSKEITFPAGTAQVQIGNNSDNGFITSKGDYIDLTARLGNERSINDVTINGNTYQVVMTDFTWSPRSCNVHLKRTDTSSTLTIPAGTAVTFNSYTRPNECDIYLCGANGVYTSANDLVAQYKAMIDKHGSNNYLVIIPFWNTYCDTPFREAFGDHCVSFREVAISTGLAYEGITPTAKDEEYISNGEVPPSLLYYPNNPDVHLNAKGYDLLAHILYEQGGAIGIW